MGDCGRSWWLRDATTECCTLERLLVAPDALPVGVGRPGYAPAVSSCRSGMLPCCAMCRLACCTSQKGFTVSANCSCVCPRSCITSFLP